MEQSVVDRLTPYLSSGTAEPVSLAPEGTQVAAESLRALHGQPGLVDAVESLALFAVWLIQEHKSPLAGRALLEVAHAEIPALEALGADAARVANEVRSAIVAANHGRYTGTERPDRSALAEPPPPGAVPAKPWTVKMLKPKK